MTPTPPPTRRALHRAPRGWRRWVGTGTTVLVVTALAWLLWPAAWGGSTSLTIVRGHSMEPGYHSGDLLIGRRGPVQLGDVVVYSPAGIDGHIVHRVVGGNAEEGWVLRGDNNSWDDPFRPTGDEIVGVVRWHIPAVGTVFGMSSPLLWLGVAVAGLGVFVWPSRERPPLDEPKDPAADDEREPALV